METWLLVKYLKCATGPEEEKAVRAWLADDPDGSHAKQYSDAHFLFEGMTLHGDPQESASGVRMKKRSVLFRIGAAAASVAAAAVLLAGVGLWVKNATVESLSARTETVYVPAGKSMELTLEDGSRLWLNSGTELEYPAVFSRKSRDVVLHSGEVMFDVANDGRRPFNVETYASTISVLGTKFNVSVDEASGEFSAALLRGSIRVDNNLNENEAFVLRPNQMVRLKDNHLLMEHFDDADAIECWTGGLINIAGVPFDHLMRKFELVFGVDIDIQCSEMPEIRYTRGKIRVTDGVEHALDMLALVGGFEYDYDRLSGTIIIK